MKTEIGTRRGPSATTDVATGVVGNARLTGMLGAVIFVLLAIEGVTILRVHQLISAHVFVGMLTVPPVALKIATTTYRFARYYAGDPEYTRKGPPLLLLRLAGPLVVVTSVAVLATGIAALAAGPGTRWLLEAHKASFILWFPLMTVHVLGHVIETPALALADWTRRARHRDAPASGAVVRAAVMLVTLAAGLVLAVLSLGWIGAWH